jgi:hypothetical protein
MQGIMNNFPFTPQLNNLHFLSTNEGKKGLIIIEYWTDNDNYRYDVFSMQVMHQHTPGSWVVAVKEDRLSDMVPKIQHILQGGKYPTPGLSPNPTSYSIQLSQKDTDEFIKRFKGSWEADGIGSFCYTNKSKSCYNSLLNNMIHGSKLTFLTAEQFNFSTLKTRTIDTYRALELFVNQECSRLNHWYVWNGRKKAEAIEKAFAHFNHLEKKPDNIDAEIDQETLIKRAKDSGLIDAFAMHRHTFFNHKTNPESHDSLLDQLEAKTRKSNKVV